MPVAHTVLREDFGALDHELITQELLATPGVRSVRYDAARKGVAIEYDPSILTAPKLFELMCRAGVYPDPHPPEQDATENNGG